MTRNTTRSFGRQELATVYFPYIQPRSAWLKLRALLADNPQLAGLVAKRHPRTFVPLEVERIFAALGDPR